MAAVERKHANGRANDNELSPAADFYRQVQAQAHLHTRGHAERWSRATLNILGLNLGRSTRRQLARALPPELGQALSGIFRLLHFRNPQQASRDFHRQIALRAGHTDAQFAAGPVTAVFHALKSLVDNELNDKISQALAPELRQIWQKA